MKSYILKFADADFVSKVGTTWRTGVIDLYANSQYKNYSVRRHPNGTNLLGTGVYTGLNQKSATQSEIGYVEGGRFIDTSGRIDITTWSIDFATVTAIQAPPSATLNIYQAESNLTPFYTSADPAWVVREGYPQSQDIYLIDSLRYVYFEIEIDSDVANLDTNYNVEMNILVDIGAPVVGGWHPKTGNLMNRYPQWMDMNEWNPQDPNFSNMATPRTVGGKFLNALAGEWLTDLQAKFDYQSAQYFVDHVDLSQKAWVYRAISVPADTVSIKGDNVELARTANIDEFYRSQIGDKACFWNRLTQEVYVNEKYPALIVDGQVYNLDPYQVWNSIDDLGVTVDLYRLPMESNESFRNRIRDVYVNRPGTSMEAFKKAVRRELNLWQFEGATPDSSYLGATPNVYELEDLKDFSEYWVDGLPTPKFKQLVEDLATKYPLTWGYFSYGKAFWDPDGLMREGFELLPRQLDATPTTFQDSGVGDGNDLYVFRPDTVVNYIEFTTKLKIRGRRRVDRTEYTPLQFNVAVYGQADQTVYVNPVFEGLFTIELTTASATYFANVSAVAKSDVRTGQATPTADSRAMIEWSTPRGFTDGGFDFYHKTTGARYTSGGATPTNMIDLSQVTTVTIKPGSWNPNTASYVNVPTQANYKLWFEGSPATVLGAGGSSVSIIETPYNWQTSNGTFYVESQMVNSAVQTDAYKTNQSVYTITLNGNNPPTTPKNFTLNFPAPTFPAGTSNPETIVEVLTYSGATAGAYSTEDSATPIFVPITNLYINSNNTWTSGKLKSFATSTTSLTFSSGTTAGYPIAVPKWETFEAVQATPISGVVDTNGPWRDGQPLPEANTNFQLTYLNSLNRASFGIPNTTDYIITWIGIDSVSSNHVLTWLDTNTVKPAVTYAGETNLNAVYPPNAVVETLSGGVYSFSAIPVYAKIKPGSNQQWLPKMHSGWFYDSGNDYYVYANMKTATTTTSGVTLSDVNRQGAPLNVYTITSATPNYNQMRQVSSFTMSDNATPSYTLTHEEIKTGDGTNKFRVGYNDVYSVTAKNLTTNTTLTVSGTVGNVVTVSANTVEGHEYSIQYRVRASYYVDNQYGDPANYKTRVVFDQTAAALGVGSYNITYEGSTYDPATPIDVPLNSLHTSMEEGFIYIDHDVHPVAKVEVNISPSRVIANTVDYAVVTVQTYDGNGNPKGKQAVTLTTTYGTLGSTTVTTDVNGFGYTTLTSNGWVVSQLTTNPGYVGTITATRGTLTDAVKFDIFVPEVRGNRILAVPSSEAILADGISAMSIQGRVESPTFGPVPGAKVTWRRGRSVYHALNSTARQATSWYFYLPGTGGNRISLPDAANLDITTDLTLTADMQMTNWTAAGNNMLISKDGSNQRSFVWLIAGSLMYLFTSPDGTVASQVSWSVAHGITSGRWEVAVTLDADNGSSQSAARFWKRPAGATSWTQIGSTVLGAVATIHSGSGLLYFGDGGTTSNKMYGATVRNGIGASGAVGGTIVVNFAGTITSYNGVAKTFAITSGQTATLASTGADPAAVVPIPFVPQGATPNTGYVTTDASGRFVIEPFISAKQPGYWFVAVESDGYSMATPANYNIIGDVVTWYEYPNVNAAVDPITNLPVATNQDATPYWSIPNYSYGSVFPVRYDEQDRLDTADASTPQWLPPSWYAINAYWQYQMGLRGTGYYQTGATPSRPEYKEL